MLYVDDTYFDHRYFRERFALFEAHPILRRCEDVRLAVRLADTAFWVALCLYVKERGGTVFPLPADTPLDAARRRAERSGCDFLLFGTTGEEALEHIAPVTPLPHAPDAPRAALIQMSSGTTGEPKYVERSWRSVDAEIESYVEHFPIPTTVTPVIACPVTHSYGLISGVLVGLRRGVAPVVIGNPNPKFILRTLLERETPLLYSSPTLIATLSLLARNDRSLFAVMTSGTTLPQAWFDGARKKFRHVHQQYGCSEAGCVALGVDIGAPNELGVPLPHLEVTAGPRSSDPREIVVRLPDGRNVETRDLGYVEEGALHFVSRLDDMINVSGSNVYPAEVEEVVLELPEITEAVVYKRPHPFGNDQVCLDFVCDHPLSDRHVREWCAQRLAPHQVPMSIRRVTHIPRLPNGKVSRRALADAADHA